MTLLRDVDLDGAPSDVRITGDTVTAIGPGLRRLAGEPLLDAHGGALLPGLCDHHLHLHALAAAAHSADCGPPAVRGRAALRAALAAAVPDEHGWVRGTGYTETVAGDLDATALDRLHPSGPVRIQHRSGALWILNSAALTRIGAATATHSGIERSTGGEPTGRFWRADGWLRSRLPRVGLPDLTAVGARLNRLGITAVTDATPDLDATALAAFAAAGSFLPTRLHLLGVPLGTQPPPGTTAGPYKIVLADSRLPGLDELSARIRRAHAADRAVAVHCVTRESLILLLAALSDSGTRAGDRVEHAALVPAEVVADLARLGLRVVTQPGFLAHRGDDYLRDVPAGDHDDLYRCASLRAAGVPLALSSDAPYGPLDPWAVIRAAADRRTPAGRVAGAAERVATRVALDAYLSAPDDPGGPPRRVRPGVPADLVLLDRPLADQLAAPDAGAVAATLVGGRMVHT